MLETVLLVEDDPLQREFMSQMLRKKLGYLVATANDGSEAMLRLKDANVDTFCAVLLDISMPVMDGFETLHAIRNSRNDLPVIILTGTGDTQTAVKAIKEGANDFVVKPAEVTQLDVVLKNAIRMSAMSRELTRMKRDKEGALAFSDLVGAQGGLAETVALGRKAAASEVPVIIMGDAGTGKELFARAIHGESRRVGSPFIAIDCGAIPENLVDSTLFGHEKGSFAGAATRTLGKFREAEGGTLFLDEISELPPDAQIKLLRALQQQEVEPIGSPRPVKINVRIISASNRDLKAEVKAGRFREDLYFHLNVLPIVLPPLRQRGDDVLSLSQHFINRFAASDMLPAKTLTADACQYLARQKWQGNVRELENLIRRALVLSEGTQIDQSQLRSIHEKDDAAELALSSPHGLHCMLRNEDGRFKTMSELESEIMQIALDHYEQNIPRAAESLDIAKSTFYRKIKLASGDA